MEKLQLEEEREGTPLEFSYFIPEEFSYIILTGSCALHALSMH
jgi:hypothetical protein